MKQGVLWRWGLALSLGLLVACGGPPTAPHAQAPQHSLNQQSGQSTPQILSKTQASGSGQVQSDPLNPGRAKLSFTLRLNSEASSGFRTKALAPERFQRVYASIYGEDIDSGNALNPHLIFAEGADQDGYLAITGNNEVTVFFSGVPYGKARGIYFSLDSDSGTHPVELAVIGNIFDLETQTSTVEVSYRTTPLYWLFVDSDFRLNYQTGAFDLATLQQRVDLWTGKTGEAPYNYTICHPILLNTDTLRNDLLAQKFDFEALSDTNYCMQPGTVVGSISGLVSSDTIDLRVTDPSSAVLQGLGNTASYSIPHIPVYDLGAIDPFYFFSLNAQVNGGTTYNIDYQPSSEVHLSSGTQVTRNLVLTPATPTLTGVSPVSGRAGDSITLTGSHFHANADGNKVTFGGVSVATEDITVLSANEMQVKVPSGISGNVDIRIAVGSQSSEAIAFQVQSLEWQALSDGLYGGYVKTIELAPSDPDIIYAGTTEGVFKSTDAGNTWQSINQGLDSLARDINTIAIDPQNPDVVYLASAQSGEVYKSLNGGNSWSLSASGINRTISDLLIDPEQSQTIYAGSVQGGVLHKSLDGGANWFTTSLAGSGNTLSSFYAGGTKIIFAHSKLNAHFIQKSLDAGETWTQLNTDSLASHQRFVKQLVVHPGNPDILYFVSAAGEMFKSTDGGESWVKVQDNVLSVAISPNNTELLYAVHASGQQILKTLDGGNTWSTTGTLNVSIPANDHIALRISPTQTDILYLGDGKAGVYKSLDAAVNWSFSNTGLTAIQGQDLIFAPDSSQIMYLASLYGTDRIYKSIDGGGSWSPSGDGIPSSLGVKALLVNPANVSEVLAGTSSTLGNNFVFGSQNAGLTWSPTALNQGIEVLLRDKNNPQRVYAGTFSSGVFISEDGGATWGQASGLTSSRITSLHQDPDQPDVLFAGTWGSPYKSTDNGNTWTSFSISGLPGHRFKLLMNPHTPSTLYAAALPLEHVSTTGLNFYKSTDSGNTWTLANTGLNGKPLVDLVADPAQPAVLYTATADGDIFRSTDSAGTWHLISQGLKNLGVLSVLRLNIQPTAPYTLYVHANNGLFKLTEN